MAKTLLYPSDPRGRLRSVLTASLLFAVLAVLSVAAPFVGAQSGRQDAGQDVSPTSQESEVGLLKLLGLQASPESIDYVQNKTQFQLHTLLTEQRHPKTWNLGERVRKDTATGLRMLFSVDEDVAARLDALAGDTRTLEAAAAAVEEAILSGRKVYVYGCGATGRLAKQMESAFWRPFWRKVKAQGKLWEKLEPVVGRDIEDRLVGEMTGADRALISSLEGFEDLLLIGRLQLEDRGIRKGDVVICVTEGGETSSVIGTVLAALDQWKAEPGYDPAESRKILYFVYNNPDGKLLPFTRSRRVIEEPGITRINLTTGPQSITGSTRMQATTSETYVVGAVLETAIRRALGRTLSAKELGRIGFEGAWDIAGVLRDFRRVLDSVRAAVPALVPFTDAEAAAYAAGRFSTYFAGEGLVTVFTDATERSPTFRLFPLDTVREPKRKCWIQVWAEAPDLRSAWLTFLGRPFRGLDPEFYRKPFEEEIRDPYLRTAALESLKKAGNDQEDLYDLSFSSRNLKDRGPAAGDIGVAVVLGEEAAGLDKPDSYLRRFVDLSASSGAATFLILAADLPEKRFAAIEGSLRKAAPGSAPVPRVVPVRIGAANDPFGLRAQVGVKMLLNAHSTAIMAKLGKIVGNTMTNVSPSNLKLIGRATFLIQSHVNDALSRSGWVRANGRRKPISYGEANAVLYDSISYIKGRPDMAGQTAEVGLSIIRILESLKQKRGLANDAALEILRKTGLSDYLSAI
jgi:N-acetylmuramic acid 6-phosphate (MurNAc-6-P) etherase